MVFSLEPKEGTQRQVFVITDGQVQNTGKILEVAEELRLQNRFFSFGIGYGASSELVKGLASATGGIAEMLGDDDDLEVKVLRALHGSQANFYDGIVIKSISFLHGASSCLNFMNTSVEEALLLPTPQKIKVPFRFSVFNII